MDAASIDQLQVIVDDQSRLGITLILFLMMISVALTLRLSDFALVRQEPLRVLGGVAVQLVGLPLLTLGLILVLSPPASIALGMLIVASCPGGNVSNVLTRAAGGNTAYSVTLTSISSVSAAVMTPLSILFWSGLYAPAGDLVRALEIDPGPFFLQTAILLALPLCLGMVINAWKPAIAARAAAILGPLALACIALLVAVGIVQNWSIFLAVGSIIIPIVILHNSAAFGLGWLAGRGMAMEAARQRALTFEVGIQNAGLGLVILLSQFDGVGGAAAIIGTWSIWHLIGGSLLAGLFRLLDSRTLRANATERES
ncbi:bile acid transporter [Maricaulis sp. W15]|uniref:BASS family bile acid:Na+ symporter n=1 Tax=Maricaulis maris TaxID=74318 RepID=A0A495DJ99_9PROT|nr:MULTISPECIES: bile acid:sodium symporter family protein [Maricaulis]OLF77891.1 bile acid transporter [Maricaulis sp. W15]RKR02719.1 BASS family bile acid:Na+ symporter [Maricaulis maris]